MVVCTVSKFKNITTIEYSNGKNIYSLNYTSNFLLLRGVDHKGSREDGWKINFQKITPTAIKMEVTRKINFY